MTYEKYHFNMENLKEHIDILKILQNPNNKYSKIILKNADVKLVNTLCEIIYNVLETNINISDTDKKELVKHKKVLLKLLKKSGLKNKRKILSQKGGFLQFVLPAVITGLASIISASITK